MIASNENDGESLIDSLVSAFRGSVVELERIAEESERVAHMARDRLQRLEMEIEEARNS
jgi:hypothetical protein